MQRALPVVLLLFLAAAALLWLVLPSEPGGTPDVAGDWQGAEEADRQAAPISDESVAGGGESRRTPLGARDLLVRVLMPDGTPARGAEVFYRLGAKEGVLLAADGTTLLSPGEGDLLIAAHAEGLWSEARQLSETRLGSMSEIRLEAREAAGQLTVQAQNSGGVALAEFEVELAWASGRDESQREERRRAGLFRSVRSDFPGRDGLALLADIPPGTYTVSVQTRTEASANATTVIDPGESATVLLQLKPGGFVVGRLLAPDGEPVSGATVYLREDDATFLGLEELQGPQVWSETTSRSHRTSSGDDGRFRVGPVAAGRYLVGVVTEGRPPFRSEAAAEVLAGRETDAGDLVLADGKSLVVEVRSETDGTPLAGARVRYMPKQDRESLVGTLRGWEEPEPSRSGADGRVTITGLGEGAFVVRADSKGFAPRETGAELGPDDASRPVVVTLARELAVRGRVMDELTAMPVAGAKITARPAEGESLVDRWLPAEITGRLREAVETAEDGSFWIGELGPGGWELVVRADDYATTIDGPLQLAYSQAEPERVIRLRRGTTLTVQVLDEEGFPKPETLVTLYGWDNQDPMGENTGEEGTAVFENLPPGNYMLSAISISSEDRAVMARTQSLGSFSQNTEMVQIEESDSEVEVVLGGIVERAAVEGYVRAGGEGRDGLTVMLYSPATTSMQNTEEGGFYHFDAVPEGEYLLMVGRFRFGSSTGWTSTLSVAGSETIHHDVDLPEARLTVRVLDAETGKPLSQVPVLLRRVDATQQAGGFLNSDSQGTATFEFVSPGEYAVTAGLASMPFFGGNRKHSTRLVSPVLVPDSFRGEKFVEVRLEAPAVLKGRVLDLRGNPVKGAGIFYLDERGQPLMQFSLKPSDANGEFELGNLPPGRGRVLARGKNLGQIEREVWLTSGETTQMELVLDTGTMVHILVTAPGGRPIKGVQAVLLDQRQAPISQLYTGTEAMAAGLAFLRGGEQVFGPLPAGSYTVLLSKYGGESVAHEIEIEPGVPDLRLELVFKP